MKQQADSKESVRARSARRQEQAAREAKLAEEHAKKEAGLLAALANTAKNTTRGCVDRFVESLDANKSLHRGHPAFFGIDASQVTPQFLAVARAIERKAPRLLEPDLLKAVLWLSKIRFERDPEDWEPRGKGRETLFRSLADHLVSKYPMPAILWNAFFDDAVAQLVPLVGHVASGGSLYAFVKDKFPIPLTRAMCHSFLTTSSEHRFLDAIRLVQCRAAGADRRFFQAWRTLRYANMVQTKEEEAFWFTVVDWFGKLTLLDPREIGPLVDYIAMRRRAEPSFSMKGRGALATIRAMHEWHGNLSKDKGVKSTIFRSCGFQASSFSDYKRVEPDGTTVKETWHVKEILTARALHDEGKFMGHCVYSYVWRVEKGDTSIWSCVMEDGKGPTGAWMMVTVEVRNDLKRIVQARGRFNRAMTTKEHQVLTRWANLNGLSVQLGGW